jgi:hypothetical protein
MEGARASMAEKEEGKGRQGRIFRPDSRPWSVGCLFRGKRIERGSGVGLEGRGRTGERCLTGPPHSVLADADCLLAFDKNSPREREREEGERREVSYDALVCGERAGGREGRLMGGWEGGKEGRREGGEGREKVSKRVCESVKRE